MDAARCAKRMGAENVYIIYRRSAEEIPARAEEIHHAVEEGIDFRYLTNPVAVKGTEDGHVCGIECVKMQLGEPDASGRRRPVEVKDSNFVLDVDCVIMAIGTKLNTLILDTTENLQANSRGGIGTDEAAATNREGVFAGGDAVTGAATVIKAMGAEGSRSRNRRVFKQSIRKFFISHFFNYKTARLQSGCFVVNCILKKYKIADKNP